MARLPRFMAIKYNCFAPSKESRPSQSPGNRVTPALKVAQDLIGADAACGREQLAGGADVDATMRFHCAYRRCGCMATRRARTAARPDAAQRRSTVCVCKQTPKMHLSTLPSNYELNKFSWLQEDGSRF